MNDRHKQHEQILKSGWAKESRHTQFYPTCIHLFPRAVVTNSHNLGDLKQQKYILSEFWTPEVQNHGVPRGAALPLGALGWVGGSIPCLFQLLIAVRISWLMATSLQYLGPFPAHFSLCVCGVESPCYFPLIRAPMMAFRAHLENPELCPHLKILNLIPSAKALFPNKVTFTGFRD